jgi:ribonuclease HI
LKKLGEYSLFFDGASRNNPGVAGAGGSLLDPQGNIVTDYAWGLGATSNNIVEAYSLLKGLSIAEDQTIAKIVVYGDSMMVV